MISKYIQITVFARGSPVGHIDEHDVRCPALNHLFVRFIRGREATYLRGGDRGAQGENASRVNHAQLHAQETMRTASGRPWPPWPTISIKAGLLAPTTEYYEKLDRNCSGCARCAFDGVHRIAQQAPRVALAAQQKVLRITDRRAAACRKGSTLETCPDRFPLHRPGGLGLVCPRLGLPQRSAIVHGYREAAEEWADRQARKEPRDRRAEARDQSPRQSEPSWPERGAPHQSAESKGAQGAAEGPAGQRPGGAQDRRSRGNQASTRGGDLPISNARRRLLTVSRLLARY